MNNIYKVIWSKAKNCYVVASEIARSHTKSASGSEKIGGGTRRKLLASLMALSLLCGGLGVAEAAVVHVNEGTGVTYEVYTTDQTYSRELVDEKLNSKADATVVVTNTKDIAANKDNITRLENNKADKTYVDTEVGKKADRAITLTGYGITDAYTKDDVNNALKDKADTKTVNALVGHVGALETTVGNASKGLVKDVNELKARGNTLNTALENKADKADLNNATNRIAANESEITALKTKTANLSPDGKELTGMTNVETGTLKVTGGISNDTGVTTTLTDIDNSMKQTATNTGEIANLRTKTDGQQTAINGLNEKTTQISYDAANHITSVNGMKVGQQVDMGGKDIINAGALTATGKVTGDGVEAGTGAITGGSLTVTGKVTGNGVDAGTGDITTRGNVNGATLETTGNATIGGALTATGKVTGDGLAAGTGAITGGSLTVTGKVTGNGVDAGAGAITGGSLSVTGDTSLKKTDVDGALNVTGESSLKNTKVDGTLGVTGATTLEGTLTAEKDATFEKDVTVQKDLTVDGKLNVDKISMKNDELKNGKKHDSATTITADEISNLAKVTEQGNTTESQFTHNEKGTFNHAKDGNTTDWKESTSNVTANGVSNKMTDSDGNTHTYYQTATETKEQLVNGDKSKSNFEKKTAEGNTISITEKDADGNLKSSLTNTQTVNEEKTSVTNEDSSSTINQGADQIRYNVTSKDENKTSSSIEVKADGITNTSKDGTITNTAKNVTNEGTESVTNKVDANEVTVSKDGVDIKAEAGKTITESVGTDTSRTMTDGRIIDKAGDMTVTTDKTTGTTFGNGTPKDTTVINGGTIGTNKVNANETNTKKLTAGADDGANGGRLTVDADGVKGSYKSGDYTSRSYILDNTLKSGVDNGKEPTDANFVGSRTDHYMVGNKAKLDETVKDADGSNVTNKTSTGTVTTITDDTGTTTTKTEQGVKDITNTAKAGTITNDAKDIVNNAQETITNKAGTSITNQVKDSEVTTDASGTTFENKTAAVSDGGTTTTKINGNRINTGRVDANELGVSDVDGTNTADLSVKAGEGVKASAGNGTTKGSLDVKADEVGSSVTDGTGKGSTFKQRIDAIMGNVKNNTTGDQSFHKQTSDVIMDNVKDGENSNNRTQTKTETKDIITDKDRNSSTTSQTASENKTYLTDKDRKNTNSTIDTAKGYDKTIKGENGETSTQQTDSMVQSYVGKKDGSATNVTTNFANASANQVTENGQTSTVLNNKDGLLIQNTANGNSFTTEDGTPTGPAQSWTNIKGNEISTGKVEANYVKMGYADVMKDLGVHGNATVKKDLTVKGTTNLKNTNVDGQLDVTQKATFHDDVDIKKNLSVGGNATITGDVTANSYKVGDKTYISAAGINANDQKITNVADGSISDGSKDAVNGGQLYGMKTDLEHKVDKVGANAAAMANLHPMEFDPDSKWNIAAAMGNYGSETATAIGAFYRPNEDVMVNFSTAFGTGENMVGGGVSVRLGKGSNKLSREESNALKDQVNDLTARMDALLSVLNPNMSKDFPDVPENHWAYEAVSRLAGNDIVQGYPDGEFHGDRTMTRYEMAEIIYNALSRGAEAERELVEEFKPELQAMAASEKATAERAEG